MDALVSTSWLASELGQAALRVLGCAAGAAAGRRYTVESERSTWEKARIPGSGFADLASDCPTALAAALHVPHA